MTTGQILYVLLATCGGLFALIKFLAGEKEKIEQRLAKHEKQISLLEERNKHAPTHDDMKQIYEKLNVLTASNARIIGTLEGIKTTSDMIVRRAMGELKNG